MGAPTVDDDDTSPPAGTAALWDDVAYIARVTQARLARGMTIAELARQTGRSPAYFRARPGKSRQTGEVLTLSAVLQVSPGYLMGLEGYRDPKAVRRLRAFADITAHVFCAMARADGDVTVDEAVALLHRLLKEERTFKAAQNDPL